MCVWYFVSRLYRILIVFQVVLCVALFFLLFSLHMLSEFLVFVSFIPFIWYLMLCMAFFAHNITQPFSFSTFVSRIFFKINERNKKKIKIKKELYMLRVIYRRNICAYGYKCFQIHWRKSFFSLCYSFLPVINR